KRRRNILRDNTFRQGIVFLVNYLWGDWPVPEHPRSGTASVKREWKEQIEKFRRVFGRTPDGISSHEHVHYFPPYFSIALGLANHYKIPFIRFGKKGFAGEKNSVYLILKIMRWINRKKFFRSDISSSDYFTSLDWVGNKRNFLRKIPNGKIEIACHPEREDEMEMIDRIF
ncbi:MAG: ChbG/HpnK family deacetylase, partial [Candidatus Moranbacteria bacterium]|nr:ChbG/HpnK family deacetylase [Candidatus Moranbacteria bacterium]